MAQTCIRHPEAPATAECKSCDRPICQSCAAFLPGGAFCSAKCLETYEEVYGKAAPPASGPRVRYCVNHSAAPAVDACAECGKAFCAECLPAPPFCIACAEAKRAAGRRRPATSVPATRREPGCANHPDSARVASCVRCGKPFCAACRVQNSWGLFCSPVCAEIYPGLWRSRTGSHTGLKVTVIVLAVAVIAVAAALLATRPSGPAPAPSAPPPAPAAWTDAGGEMRRKAEADRLARERAAAEQRKKDKAEEDRRAREKEDAARAKEDREKERLAKEKAEKEKKEEAERLARAREEERLAKEKKAAEERIAREKAEEERRAKEKAEADRRARQMDRLADPWKDEKPGAWYRFRTTKAETESYADFGLKAKGVLVTQAHAGGKSSPEESFELKPKPVRPAGRETVEIDGAQFDCDVYEIGAGEESARVWVVQAGPHAGGVVRSVTAGRSMRALRLRKEALRAGDRDFACDVIESEEAVGEARSSVIRWTSAQCPLGDVKVATARGEEKTVYELVAAGQGWYSRPPVPVPAVEGAERAARARERAAALINEAAPSFKEVGERIESLPEGRSDLEGLLRKAEEAERGLDEARRLYVEVQERAPDPAVQRRIDQLGGLLEKIRLAVSLLRERLK